MNTALSNVSGLFILLMLFAVQNESCNKCRHSRYTQPFVDSLPISTPKTAGSA